MSAKDKNIVDTDAARISQSYKNGQMLTERHLDIIKLIGLENAVKIFDAIGGEKISFFPIHCHQRNEKIKELKETTNLPYTEISKIAGCTSRTVYNTFKKLKA